MNDHLRWCIETYVPDGFRDDDGVWHDGPHRRDALAALANLEAVAEAARELEVAHKALIDAVTPGKWEKPPEVGSDEYTALFSAWHAASRSVRAALRRLDVNEDTE